MNPKEIEDLARRIADLVSGAWVPGPVRPVPPGDPTPGMLPPWSGSAQKLGDVAPSRSGSSQSGRHRPAYDAITAAWRQAAAARGPSPLPGGRDAVAREARAGGRTVTIGISNRHIHISKNDFEKLFGSGKALTVDRPITQPSQFAAVERLEVSGPDGSIKGVRIVGPFRDQTQVELAASDCRRLGLTPPIRNSGVISGSAPVRLVGPAGTLDLKEGAIIAARHVHLSPADAERMGFKDGDRVSVVVGDGDRQATLHDLLVRAGPTHATEMHLDTDEAASFGVANGDPAVIVGRPSRPLPTRTNGRKALLTERDVSALAARGETLSGSGRYLITPAARDRAKALGIWRDG